MRRAFFRELKPYSRAGIAAALDCDIAHALNAIERLMIRGIVRFRSSSSWDGVDGTDEEGARADELYQFCFVGIVALCDWAIVVYPKYFRSRTPSEDELRQILRVIRRSESWSSIAKLVDDGERAYDRLPVLLALLDLYAEHGVYSNYVEGHELNGPGVIEWGRTIGRHLPVLTDEAPIYIDFETRKTLRDESDFITRLHRAVLTECSRELIETGIGGLLSVEEVLISEEDVDGFGDTEMLAARLERERAVQYVDWKIAILELLERYLLGRQSAIEREDVRSIGTTSFYHVWEIACKVAFGDLLGVRLRDLGIPLAERWRKRGSETLLQIVPRPTWERAKSGGSFIACGDVDTLVPDTVTFREDIDGTRTFCIFDAKYYVPSLRRKMVGQPGLESVTKQFLYQSAYRNFVRAHDFDRVVNAFLVPSCDSELRMLARVSFPEVMGTAKEPLSNFVNMWALPAAIVFDAYLDGSELNAPVWDSLWSQTDSGSLRE